MLVSISREAFGSGALFAVSHLIGKAPGLYSMETILVYRSHLQRLFRDTAA